MGKLTIVGHAEKEYEYDLMDIKIRFNSSALTTKEATKKTNEQCEEFLAIIKSKGVPAECIRVEEISIERDIFGETNEIMAKKGVVIGSKLDIPLINLILMVICENDFSAELETDYRFSNEGKIDQELLVSAIEDSKKRATIIAENLDQDLTGIESVEVRGSRDGHILDKFGREVLITENIGYDLERSKHTNLLKAPAKLKSSSVEVIWNIE